MNMSRIDIITGAFLCLFGIFIFISAPITVGEYDGAGLSPASFPSALSAIITVLSALLCWNGWRKHVAETRDTELDESSSQAAETKPTKAYIIAAIVVMGLYIVGMPLFGYLLATSAALLALSVIYGNRQWLGLFIVACVTPPVLFYFFQQVMTILLPEASLF